MNNSVCFYFEGMTFELSEAIWRQSDHRIPDWVHHFLVDVLKEGFSVVGVFTDIGKAMKHPNVWHPEAHA